MSSSLVALLRDLPAGDWDRPTIAGAWLVRDVVAHLLDSTLRRLAFHRDGMTPPPPSRPITFERDFVAFINALNAQWVTAAKRLSPRVLTDLYARASGEVADWFEALPLDAPALFAVSWAGEDASAGWFDIGREFTELWHHQAHVRLAVDAPQLDDPRFLAAVLDVAVRGLPHAFRDVPAGRARRSRSRSRAPAAAAGRCPASRRAGRCGAAARSARRPGPLSDDTAWRLLFNALPELDAADEVTSRAARTSAVPSSVPGR